VPIISINKSLKNPSKSLEINSLKDSKIARRIIVTNNNREDNIYNIPRI